MRWPTRSRQLSGCARFLSTARRWSQRYDRCRELAPLRAGVRFVPRRAALVQSRRRPGASAKAQAEGLTVPASVNYVGKGADLYRAGFRDGAAHVVVKYLRSTWLWDKVRVQGGAYGGVCRFDRRSGGVTFVSYRDPNLLATLDVYDRTPTFLKRAEPARVR